MPTDAPSPFLRRLLAREGIADEGIIDHMVAMDDRTLTQLLRSVEVDPLDTTEDIDGLIHDMSKTFRTSGFWIAACIRARVLDRCLEENA
jgi:hypothetical protein